MPNNVRCGSGKDQCHWKGPVERAYVPNRLELEGKVTSKVLKEISPYLAARYLCRQCAEKLHKLCKFDSVVSPATGQPSLPRNDIMAEALRKAGLIS